jgi:hypothetical protein
MEAVQKRTKFVDDCDLISQDVHANSCIWLSFAQCGCVRPEFTNQIFPEERLLGWIRPELVVTYTSSLEAEVTLDYDECVGPIDTSVKNLRLALQCALPVEFPLTVRQRETGKQLPQTVLDKSPLVPPGVRVLTHNVDDNVFSLYHCEPHRDAVDSTARMFHERCQGILLWFIDGASAIDLDDPRWELFYLISNAPGQETCFAGFYSSYTFKNPVCKHYSFIFNYWIISLEFFVFKVEKECVSVKHLSCHSFSEEAWVR